MVYVIKEWGGGVICCAGTRSTAVVRGSMQGHAHPRKVVKKVRVTFKHILIPLHLTFISYVNDGRLFTRTP